METKDGNAHQLKKSDTFWTEKELQWKNGFFRLNVPKNELFFKLFIYFELNCCLLDGRKTSAAHNCSCYKWCFIKNQILTLKSHLKVAVLYI